MSGSFGSDLFVYSEEPWVACVLSFPSIICALKGMHDPASQGLRHCCLGWQVPCLCSDRRGHAVAATACSCALVASPPCPGVFYSGSFVHYMFP